MIDIQHDAQQLRFVLRPNQSISWRGLRLFFAALCVVSLSIALALTLLGFWPVLPFAGLEMLAVGAGLYAVARRGQVREVIYIDPQSVRIERGREAPDQQWQLARTWAKVVLERCPKQWYPSRLLIRSHGRSIEIGSFLNEDERQRLAHELGRDLGWA